MPTRNCFFLILFCVLAHPAPLCVSGAPAKTGHDGPVTFDHREKLSGIVDTMIIGGEYVDIEKLPYQLSLEWTWRHVCGAAILSPKWAITAGRCAFDLDTLFSKYVSWLRAGATAILPFCGTTHSMEKMIPHPNYQITSMDYDVAVILVKNPFEYSQRIKPIAIAQGEENTIDYSSNVATAGWGATADGNLFMPVYLKEVSFPLVPRNECRQAFENGKITDRMLCAGGRGLGDICQGDGGSPLVQNGLLIGIASKTQNCNQSDQPGVYTNLLNNDVRNFITNNTGL